MMVDHSDTLLPFPQHRRTGIEDGRLALHTPGCWAGRGVSTMLRGMRDLFVEVFW